MNRGFHHQALLYESEPGFVEGCSRFVREALDADEPVLVMVAARRIGLLREELGAESSEVVFADMGEVGANPARIIPAWREFAEQRSGDGVTLHGIGEPIWPERTPAELVECQRHESLLNLAFADAPSFRLLCPYDVKALDRSVIEEAHRSHPVLRENGSTRRSDTYRDLDAVAAPFDSPLPEPPGQLAALNFDGSSLDGLRRFVAAQARDAGMADSRAVDLVLAVNEVATNSVRHAGGRGVLRVWREPGRLVCEITDGGRIVEALAGRERPARGRAGGHGLWLVNQLCDLAQVRSFRSGSAVRLHMRLA